MMSSSENPFVSEMSSGTGVNTGKSLRWWPAASCLALMGLLKVIPSLMESPPLPVLMMGFMGPAAACLLIMTWWLFASRAGWKEKVAGLIGTVCCAVVTGLLAHPSMQGMSSMLYQIPSGFAAFALTLIPLAIVCLPWNNEVTRKQLSV